MDVLDLHHKIHKCESSIKDMCKKISEEKDEIIRKSYERQLKNKEEILHKLEKQLLELLK
jgi:bacterioferritin (cytochrome b1)